MYKKSITSSEFLKDKQECIPVGCVLPTRYQDTPLDREPPDRDPPDRDPLDRDSPGQR